MIANSAFLAAMVLMLLTFSLAGQLSFLAPHKHLILRQYGSVIVVALGIVFIKSLRGLLSADAEPVSQGHGPQAGARREAAADGRQHRRGPVGALGRGGLSVAIALRSP